MDNNSLAIALHRRKTVFAEKLKDLNTGDLLKILQIVYERQIPFTENGNGIWFAMSKVDEAVLEMMEEVIRKSEAGVGAIQ